MAWPERLLAASGALAGCAGVGLSAAAAHLTGPGSLATAAAFLLAHAPALMVTAGLVASGFLQRALGRIAGSVTLVGLMLFSGDLAVRALAGLVLLPNAAPTGGVLLMAGWLLAGLAALFGPRFAETARQLAQRSSPGV
ncbi:MAG: hypothetical protein JWR08_308 [Enterovirga sp.]|nr:hypothetical protein [Enterovirga sp.]